MDREIIEAIQKITKTQFSDAVAFLPCTVNSVNIPARTIDCTPIGGDSGTEIPNVQLMAEVDDGLLLVPTMGSTVFVTYSTRNVPYVSLFSQVDQVLMISGSSSTSIADGLIQFNDGSYGGLVQVVNLVEKLNNLENLVNNLITTFNGHTHMGVQSGGDATLFPVILQNGTLSPTQRGDIENTVIVHGK